MATDEKKSIPPEETGRNQPLKLIDPTECNCKRCVFWKKSSSLFYSYSTCNDTDNTIDINNINEKVLDSNSTNADPFIETEPKISKSEIVFHTNVNNCLKKLGIKEPLDVQKTVWSRILLDRNVAIIADPAAGKTFAYLPPVMSKLLNEIDVCNAKTNQNSRIGVLQRQMCPFTLIICPNSMQVLSILGLIYKFELPEANFHYLLMPIEKHGAALYDKNKVYLLICSPDALIEAIDSQLVDLRFLKIIVIESFECLSDYQVTLCHRIIKEQKRLFSFYNIDERVQFIIVSNLWLSHIYNMNSYWKLNLECKFGSKIEGCLYFGHHFSLNICNDDEKSTMILSKIRNFTNNDRILIIANKSGDMRDLKKRLKKNSIKFTVHSEDTIFNLKYSNSSTKVLDVFLVSDFSLKLFFIKNITCIIHYNLPDLWETFQNRFSILCKYCEMKHNLVDVMIFYDPVKTILESYRLICLLRRLNSSHILDEMYNNLVNNFEVAKSKENRELCPSFLLKGRCSVTSHFHLCKRLHLLIDKDNSSIQYPKSGKLQCILIEMQSPSRFFVRISKVFDKFDQEVPIKEIASNYFFVNHELSKLQSKLIKKRLKLQNVEKEDLQIGYQCAYINERTIQRVRIIQINNTFTYDVILIDRGLELFNIDPSNLYYLNDSLKNAPPTVVEVNIAYLVPFNIEDQHYCLHCFHIFSDQINSYLNKKSNIFIEGNILLKIGSRFWLDDFLIMTDSPSSASENSTKLLSNRIQLLSVRNYLIRERLARYDNNVLESFSKNSNVPINDVIDISLVPEQFNNPSTLKNIEWAFLEKNEFSFCKVDVITINSQNGFLYLNISAFQILLNRLETELNSNPADLKPVKFQKQNYYLAKSKFDNRYHRAFVGRDERNGRVWCFLVDIGRTEMVNVSDLRCLDQYYVNKLPFQAIKCRLWGLNVTSDLTFDIIDKIHSMNSMSAYCYDIEQVTNPITNDGCMIHNNVYAVVLVSNTITLNDWLPKEYPLQFAVKDNENFLILQEKITENFEDNKDNDINSDDEDDDNDNNKIIVPKSSDNNLINDFNYSINEDVGIYDFNIPLVSEFAQLAIEHYAEIHKKKEIYEKPQNVLTELKLMPKIKNDNSLFPDIYWFQTTKLIILNIKILNPYDSKVIINKNRIHFTFEAKTKTDSKKFYKVECNLYKQISRAFQLSEKGFEVVLKFKKHLPDEDWSSLTENDSIYRNWIRRNPNAAIRSIMNSDEENDDNLPIKKDMSKELKAILKACGPSPNEIIIEEGSEDEFGSDLSDSGAED